MSGKKVSCEDLKARRGSGIDELIWHTTGSGTTLTSFKTAKLARGLAGIEKPENRAVFYNIYEVRGLYLGGNTTKQGLDQGAAQ